MTLRFAGRTAATQAQNVWNAPYEYHCEECYDACEHEEDDVARGSIGAEDTFLLRATMSRIRTQQKWHPRIV